MKLKLLTLFIAFFLYSNSAHALLPIGLTFGAKVGTEVGNKSNFLKNLDNKTIGANAQIKLFSFRGEVEALYRNNFITKNGFKTDITQINTNLYYDIIDLMLVKFYINAGIGNAKYSKLTKDNNFSWNAGFGTTFSLLGILNLDAGYRYIDLGKFAHQSQRAHEIYTGFRMGF